MRPAVLLLLASIAGCHAEPAPGPGPGPGPKYTPIYYSDVVFADGQYVKVGTRTRIVDGGISASIPSDGIIAVSTDGTTWQITVEPECGGLVDVAFGDGRWLAVGSGLVKEGAEPFREVKASFSAVTGGDWEPFADPPDRVTALAYGAGRFVAAGNNGLAQAADGETWEPIATTETLWWGPGVEYVSERFVAFGEGPALLDSVDGVTWRFFETELTEVTDMAASRDGIVGHGYYDCCFGEVPDGQTHFTLTWTAESDWIISED